MIEPPPDSFINGAQVCTPRTVPVTFTSKTLFHCSISTSGNLTRSFLPDDIRQNIQSTHFFFDAGDGVIPVYLGSLYPIRQSAPCRQTH